MARAPRNELAGKTRVSLLIYEPVTADGRHLYHVMHIGFFPHRMAEAVAKGLDARSIAFHSSESQRGLVDVVTANMDAPDAERVTVYHVRQAYEPRRIAMEA